MDTPVSTKAHHCQLPATPYCRTCCVTQFGVSLLKVVATIESPASHHGTERPDAKNSDVFLPARLPKNSAGAKQISSDAATMIQSMSWSFIVSIYKTFYPLSPSLIAQGVTVSLLIDGARVVPRPPRAPRTPHA